MPRRHIETEIRYLAKHGCLRFPAAPPRPVVVIPDPPLIRLCRGVKCRWLLVARKVNHVRRKAGKMDA